MGGVIIIYFLFIAFFILRTMKARSGASDKRQRDTKKQPSSGELKQTYAHRSITDYSAGEVREPGRASKKEPARAPSADMSTTAYLQKKADEDMRDHIREKAEEQRRASLETGGLPSATRLYDGDSVPAGMRVVRCGYCAADNLVPMTSRSRFTCYFCREELD